MTSTPRNHREAGSHEQQLHALTAAAARGSRDALARLSRATQAAVRPVLTPLSSHGDVEDLTQETFLRAIRALPDFAGRSSVRTWLFGIARRTAADAVRRAVRRPRIAARVDWQSALPAAVGFEDEHALRDLLSGLPAERREAFVLTQIAGFSYAEAAEICECPVGTIRSRVARAREHLVAAMGPPTSARRSAG